MSESRTSMPQKIKVSWKEDCDCFTSFMAFCMQKSQQANKKCVTCILCTTLKRAKLLPFLSGYQVAKTFWVFSELLAVSPSLKPDPSSIKTEITCTCTYQCRILIMQGDLVLFALRSRQSNILSPY